jgi:hypothetical protein
VEIINVSAREIFFAAEPLRLISFSSGAVAGVQEVLAETGRLPVGAVVVMGDAATGRALVADGLLRATDAALAGALTGTVFTDTGAPDGRAVFIKRGFSFNGDDALEVRINGARSDDGVDRVRRFDGQPESVSPTHGFQSFGGLG